MYVDLGNRKVGKNFPTYIVAEIGINHNGNMDLAKKTIIAAKEAGADSVKFQNYRTEDFVPIKNLEYEYFSEGKKFKEFQYDLFKKYELNDEQIIELKKFCDANKIDFHSTPTNTQGVDLLKRIGVSVLKNGSDYLTNIDLIKYMGKSGLPTVLSTGMALISEIDEAVSAFRSTGNNKLLLLNCTSCYPTLAEDIHLKKIKTLRDVFRVVSGFSDHSDGPWAAVGSIIYGAAWIEKHFTLDKNLPGPDHIFSSDPKQFSKLVEGVRYMEKAIGNKSLGPTSNENNSRKNFRLCCCAAKDLEKGYVLTVEDLSCFRAGIEDGIPIKNLQYIVGRKLKQNVAMGMPLILGTNVL